MNIGADVQVQRWSQFTLALLLKSKTCKIFEDAKNLPKMEAKVRVYQFSVGLST